MKRFQLLALAACFVALGCSTHEAQNSSDFNSRTHMSRTSGKATLRSDIVARELSDSDTAVVKKDENLAKPGATGRARLAQ